MTAEEICDMYGYAVSSLERNFTRTQRNILKKYGVYITKNGGDYFVRPLETAADFLQANEEGLVFNTVTMTMENVAVLILTGLALSPNYCFFGLPQEFLRFMDVPADEDTLEIFLDGIYELMDKEYIVYEEDEDWIHIRVPVQMIREMKLEEAKRVCKNIEIKNRMRKNGWIRLFKMWIIIQTCDENMSDRDIMLYCGSSVTWISKARPLLKKTDMYVDSVSFREDEYRKLDRKLQFHQKRLVSEGMISKNEMKKMIEG